MSNKMTRRFFLISSAALPIGCALRGPDVEERVVSAMPVRQPALGQSWRYAKRDLYTHALLDDQTDRVAAVDHTVDIDSSSEPTAGKNTASSRWGTRWLQKYIPRRETPTGPLPSEIQDPWGKILVDPHWSQVQVYKTPIPLWPVQLRPGWRSLIITRYQTAEATD